MQKQKLLLVYIGNEQGSWGSIAYPKPAHFYIMPGILYCAAALRNDDWISERFEVEHRYFNRTVQSCDEIRDMLILEHAACIGFSFFCWNVRDSLLIANQIHEQEPSILIVGGGPEVSLQNKDELTCFFAQNKSMSMLAFGESENKIAALIKAAITSTAPPSTITGYAFSPKLGSHVDYTKEYIKNSADIPAIYPFNVNVKHSDTAGLAMVYETGRGCPYRCIYCQFSHRNHKPYRFSLERVTTELTWLFEQGIECIHFADAVFDMDAEYAKQILNMCVTHNKTTSLFFYCSFYRLDEELAQLFEKTQAQICVGIQSTNPTVLSKINRALSPRLFHDIKEILDRYHLNFYTDLIFGLPLDSIESFFSSFSETVRLNPSFIMVFPLSLVKGTPLEQHAQEYGIKTYSREAIDNCNLLCDIEYPNIALYEKFTLNDLVLFDDCALALFYFYTRFRLSLRYLEQRCGKNTALLYQTIGHKTKKFLKSIGQKATNTNFIGGFEDQIRAIFLSQATAFGAKKNECAAFEEIFKLDIFRILMASSPQREKLFTNGYSKSKNAKNNPHNSIHAESLFLKSAPGKNVRCAYTYNDLQMLSSLGESIEQCAESVYIYSPFQDWDVHLIPLTTFQEVLLDAIPTDRPVRMRQVMSVGQRYLSRNDTAQTIEKTVLSSLHFFVEHKLIMAFENPAQ